LKGAATENAYLEDRWRSVSEALEMALVDIEIVEPLVKSLFSIVEKISLQKSVSQHLKSIPTKISLARSNVASMPARQRSQTVDGKRGGNIYLLAIAQRMHSRTD
jgi:hypothetical protein